MNVICYIRRTKLWAEEYRYSGEWVDVWQAHQTASLWDSIFTTTYRDFRRQLHLLQLENLQEVGFARVLNQYEYRQEPDVILVPTDDDDWFSPEIIGVLQERPQPTYWNFVNYTEGIISIHNPSIHSMKFVYESNNYSLVGPAPDDVLRDHRAASRLNGTHIDACLSVHNRSLASLSVLRGMTAEQVLAMYEVVRGPLKVDPGVPEYFMKYVERMRTIYRNLRTKKVLL